MKHRPAVAGVLKRLLRSQIPHEEIQASTAIEVDLQTGLNVTLGFKPHIVDLKMEAHKLCAGRPARSQNYRINNSQIQFRMSAVQIVGCEVCYRYFNLVPLLVDDLEG